jgi:hypothetical protein
MPFKRVATIKGLPAMIWRFIHSTNADAGGFVVPTVFEEYGHVFLFTYGAYVTVWLEESQKLLAGVLMASLRNQEPAHVGGSVANAVLVRSKRAGNTQTSGQCRRQPCMQSIPPQAHNMTCSQCAQESFAVLSQASGIVDS